MICRQREHRQPGQLPRSRASRSAHEFFEARQRQKGRVSVLAGQGLMKFPAIAMRWKLRIPRLNAPA
jgi:hypothetical protein